MKHPSGSLNSMGYSTLSAFCLQAACVFNKRAERRQNHPANFSKCLNHIDFLNERKCLRFCLRFVCKLPAFCFRAWLVPPYVDAK